MKNQPILFFLLFTIVTYSQEKRKLINGNILFDTIVASDVHIINKNTNTGTITNDKGWFEIPVIVGDSLHFSHINLQEKNIVITEEMLAKKTLSIHLGENTYALDGFTIEKKRSIFYVDPEIVPPATVNAKTLNLPYANTVVKKDNSIVSLNSGASISLTGLINALNGNTKREKELKKITLEDSDLSKIRKHFTDDFFITDLQIKKEHINLFLNYCFKKNITFYFNKNNNLKVTKILMDQSKIFPQKINSDSLLVIKK